MNDSLCDSIVRSPHIQNTIHTPPRQYPGVAASYGIEHEKVRWQLSLHNLKHLLQAADEEEAAVVGAGSDPGSAPSSPSSAVSSSSGEENKINHKVRCVA